MAGRLRRAAGQLRHRAAQRAFVDSGRLAFDRLPRELAFRLAYNVVLRREPDPSAVETYLPRLMRRELQPSELVDWLRGSDEFEVRTPLSVSAFGPSLHASRCQFIRSLPKAQRILDLGGTHLANPWGAFVLMGYPYDFELLTVVDLPPDDRHPLYHGDTHDDVQTSRGPVRYSYHSMTDLSAFDDGSFDLVYSGQSIEHVTEQDGALVCKEVMRVLRPGGWFALDTPNARVTRLQTPDFIDPDHEIEYTAEQLARLLVDAGFEITSSQGLNYAGRSVAAGSFDEAEVAANRGLYAAGDECYLLAVVAQKPV